MIEQTVEVPAQCGAIETFLVHPERIGPYPVVLLFMDAPGVRDELRDMARRLASVGYYVMLPDLYHRPGERPPVATGGLQMGEVMDDADRLLNFADLDPAASPGHAGCIGYCMGGPYAVNFAARHPERIGAAASICGVKLVTDQDDSPHLALRRARGEVYFACAESDDWAPIEMVEALETAAKAHKPASEVEVYAGARHGFVFPSAPAYERTSAERHWERLFSLFRRRLQPA
jgi:carboxymethylenebutenolidase